MPAHIARALSRYGAPIELAHERTARARLTYDWDYAKVIKPPPDGPTVAPPRPHALPIAEAVAVVAAGDRRPFMVLRECWQCGGGDETDIGRKLANEKTILYAKWFRCVRVSDAVRHPDHPLHAMFEGVHAPHLVLGAADGELIPIRSGEPLSTVWATMRRLITAAYDGDPDAAIDEELQILSRYDHLDNLDKVSSTRLDALLAEQSAESSQVSAVRRQLAEVQDQRRELEARERIVLHRALRKEPKR